MNFSLPSRGRVGVGASGVGDGHALPAPIPAFPQRGQERIINPMAAAPTRFHRPPQRTAAPTRAPPATRP
ncbi:hypothetical protein EJI00_19280 [Variovorax sp. DXTD-1]|nr:hypothetical protein EJI00_19280 [Variovorax sp. DXTD-1]